MLRQLFTLLLMTVGVLGLIGGSITIESAWGLEQSSGCNRFQQQDVCLQSVKRSAKYPWEFRLQVTQVNARPKDRRQRWLLNCQTRTLQVERQSPQTFTPGDFGSKLCQKLRY